MKKIWMPTITNVAARIASRSSRERAEAVADPARDDRRRRRRPRRASRPRRGGDRARAGGVRRALEARVALAEVEDPVRAAAEPEREHLRADDRRAASRRSACARRSGGRQTRRRRTRAPSSGARAATITTPGRMKRKFGLCTSIRRRWRQPSRNGESFDVAPRGCSLIGSSLDPEPDARRADHHLRGELHPGGAEAQLGQHVAAHARMPQCASATLVAEDEVEEPAQQRVADPAERRHRPVLDAAHPVPHHELGARGRVRSTNAGISSKS